MQTAALYLRSSKDRHDVSLDAQRRELQLLAQAKSLAIVEEFADPVERADDGERPGFQALLKRLKDRERGWAFVLVLDTSRIARQDQYLAAAFNYECEKRGIRVLYSKLPETNSIMDVVMKSMMRSFDQLHSLMSREKGLAGMAENVRQGFRAGGSAPRGYRLDRVATGAVRDGAAVTKSRLAIDAATGPAIAAYLKARAGGVSRTRAAAAHGFDDTTSSLIGIEWNALTYAGHTVWNVNAERMPQGGYKGGTKRRPRADWVINYDTHPPLITTEEAEQILAELERGRRRLYRTSATYLLTGLLVSPAGAVWHSSGDGYYRIGKGRRGIQREKIEAAIVARVLHDLRSKPFTAELTRECRRISAPPTDAELKALRAQVTALTTRIARAGELAGQCEAPRVFLEQIAEAERQRAALTAQLQEKESAAEAATVLRAVGESDVERMLGALAAHLVDVDRDALKEMLAGLAERITLDPATLACRIHYRIPTGELVASPRRTDQFPALRAVRELKVA